MPEIILPQPKQADIYSFGFDRNLNKASSVSKNEFLSRDLFQFDATSGLWFGTEAGLILSTRMSQLINSNTDNVTISNTTTETTLYSFTLPGKSMGKSNLLWVRLLVSVKGNAIDTVTLRPKFNATLVSMLRTPANATHDGYWDFFAIGTGTEDLFEFHTTLIAMPEQNVTANAAMTYWRPVPASTNRDTQIDQTISFTAEWSVASVNLSFGKQYAFAVLYRV